MKIASKKLSQRILNAGFAFVLALSTLTASTSAFLGQTANATTAPLSVETLCVDEKVQLKVTARQAELPGIPLNANAWRPGLIGSIIGNINYTTDFGSERNTLDEDDVDTHTFITGQTSVSAGSVSAHVFGEYKTGLTWLFSGHSYENTLNANYPSVNCDETAPVVTASYTPDSLTNSSVLATINANEEIQDITGWDRVDLMTLEKSYAANTDETVTVADLAGNTTDINVLIDWIDTEKPTILATPSAPSYISGTQNFDIYVTDDNSLDESKNKSVWVEVYGDPDWSNKKGAKVDLSDGSGVFTVNTTTLPDGEYILRIGTVEDAAGNTSGVKTFRHFTVDNTRPSINLSTPTDGQLTKGSFTISGTASDANGVEKVIVHVGKRNASGGFAGYVIDGVEANWGGTNFTYDVSGLPEFDGTYYVRAKAVDPAGNNRSAGADDIVVDKTAPTVALTNPADGSLHSGPVELHATVEDAHPHHYWLQIKKDGSVINIPGVTGTRNDTTSFTNKSLTTLTQEGEYEVTLAARDAAGGGSSTGNRSGNVVINFTIDTTAPNVEYVKVMQDGNDISGGLTNERPITVEWLSNDSDVAFYEYKNASGWHNLGTDTSFTGNIGGNKANVDGTYTYCVRATDYASNTSPEVCASVTLDETVPGAPVVENPLAGQFFNGSSALNSWSEIIDDNGIKQYEVKYVLSTGTAYRYETTTSRTQTFTGDYQGPITISVRAQDNAGNWGEFGDEVTYYYDSIAPVLTYVDYAENDNVITPDITIDDDAGVTYQWSSNAGVTISDETSLTPDFTVNIDGTYTFTLVATDEAGNSSAVDFTFTYTTPEEEEGSGTPTSTGGFSDVFTQPTTPPANDGDDEEVLGAQDQNDDNGGQEVLGTNTAADKNNVWMIFGLAWYWWLLILAVVSTFAWWLTRRFRQGESA